MELRVKKIRIEYDKMEMKSDNNSIEIEKPRLGGSWLDIQFDEEIDEILAQLDIRDISKYYNHQELLKLISMDAIMDYLYNTDNGRQKLDEIMLKRQRLKKLGRIIK